MRQRLHVGKQTDSVVRSVWFSLLEGRCGRRHLFAALTSKDLSSRLYSGRKKPLDQHSSVNPEVLATAPVLVLGKSKLKLQELTSDAGVLIDVQPLLQKFPTTVDKLGT